MKTNVINPAGNWDTIWTPKRKKKLEIQKNNTEVGEKLLVETDSFKVWSITVQQGESLPFHKHCNPYFFTAINKGKSRSYYGDGKITETEYEANDLANFEDLNEENFFIHNLINVGETVLQFTTVEFKI